MQIISNIALISINETLIVQMISFLIFLFIINRLMFRPLKDTMDGREVHIDGIRMEIENAENQLDLIRTQLQEKESAVRKEAREIRKGLEESGNREAATIFEEVREEIGTQKQKTLTEMESRLKEAREQIEKESETLSIIIIEKVLDRRIA